MNKKFILFGAAVVLIAAGAFFVFKNSGKNNVANNSSSSEIASKGENNLKENANTNTGGSDICSTFSKESIASITGLDIVSAEIFSVEGSQNSNCRYYVRGKSYAPVLVIGKYESDPLAEKQKYANEKYFPGWRVLTDSRIAMDNFITYNEVQQLNDVYLITGTSEYYRVTLYSLSMLSGSQMINLASHVAEKIK
jgi:hypothetical protein